MSRYLTTSAITLRVQPWREDDRLYTLYGRGLGVVEALAEGSAKPTSKLAGHLEPFGEVAVTLVRRGHAVKLTGAVCRRHFASLTATAGRSATAGACVRVTRQLLDVGQIEPAGYQLLRTLLEEVDRGVPDEQLPTVSSVYSLQLISALGWRPQLERCGRCGRAVAAGAFDPAGATVCCPTCARRLAAGAPELDAASLSYLRELLALPLPSALRLPLSPNARPTIEAVVRQLAAYHVTDAVGAEGQ